MAWTRVYSQVALQVYVEHRMMDGRWYVVLPLNLSNVPRKTGSFRRMNSNWLYCERKIWRYMWEQQNNKHTLQFNCPPLLPNCHCCYSPQPDTRKWERLFRRSAHVHNQLREILQWILPVPCLLLAREFTLMGLHLNTSYRLELHQMVTYIVMYMFYAYECTFFCWYDSNVAEIIYNTC